MRLPLHVGHVDDWAGGGRCVGIRCVGLVVMSAAVEVIVVVSESIVVPLGDSWVGCAVMGLGRTGLAVMWGGRCWADHK